MAECISKMSLGIFDISDDECEIAAPSPFARGICLKAFLNWKVTAAGPLRSLHDPEKISSPVPSMRCVRRWNPHSCEKSSRRHLPFPAVEFLQGLHETKTHCSNP